MAKLDSLVVDLQLNSAALRSGLESAKGALASFGDGVKGIGDKLASLTQMQGFQLGKDIVKGLSEFVLKGAEAADKMGKLAQAAGEPVEVFSRLDYAAGLAGVSSEELGAAFTKLNVNLSKAASGGRDQAALFQALGVSVKDASGNVRESSAVMSDLATRFAGLKDGASKSALAVEVFGKSGANLLPFLNEGGEGLAKLGAEADRFGITITAGASEAAQRFNDDLEKLQRATEAVGTRVAAELAPALSNLTEQLLGSKEGADALRAASEILANVIKVLVSAGVIVGAVFDAVGTSIGRAASAIYDAAHGNFEGVMTLQAGFITDMVDAGSTAVDRLKAVWADGTGAAEGLAKDHKALESADKRYASYTGGKKWAAENEAALKALSKVAVDYESKVAGFGAGPIEEMAARLEHGDLAAQLSKIGAAADDMKARILAAVTALADLELGRAQMKAEFTINEAAATTSQNVRQRTQNFDNSDFEANEQAKKGFQSFAAAIESYAENTEQAVRMSETANLLRVQGDEEGAQAALKSAASAQRMADKASAAADAFQQSSDAFIGAVASAAKQLMSQMGDVGQIIGSAAQGAATAGPWGAIIAVIGELLSRLEVFTKFSDMLNEKLFASLAELNEVLKPLFEVLGQFSEMLNPIRQIIHSIISLIFDLLKPVFAILIAVFDGIGQILTPIADALEGVFSAISAVTEALNNMEPVTWSLGIVFKTIGATINFAAIGIMGIALGIVRFVQEIIKATGGNFTSMKQTGDDIEKKLNQMGDKQKNFDLFQDTTHKSGAAEAGPKVSNTPPSGKADIPEVQKVSVVNFNEMMTNLPTGFKGLKDLRFKADGSVGGGGGSSSGGGPPTGMVTAIGATPAYGDLVQDANGNWKNSEGTNGDPGHAPGVGEAQALVETLTAAVDNALDHAQATGDYAGYQAAQVALAAAIQALAAAIQKAEQDQANGEQGYGWDPYAQPPPPPPGSSSTPPPPPPGSSAGGGVHFHGSVTLMARNFTEFVKQMAEAQELQDGQARRNPYKAKT